MVSEMQNENTDPLPGKILCAIVKSMQETNGHDISRLIAALVSVTRGNTALFQDSMHDLNAIRDFLLSNSGEGEQQTLEQLRAKLKVIPPSFIV
tara:strand:+ start:875 stop:1156 length:282 start_codon:yes stop_codon:yes gene_type:complete